MITAERLLETLYKGWIIIIIVIIIALQPFVGSRPLFQILEPVHGMTPWTGNHPVARPLTAHRTRQTQNKDTQCLGWHSNPRSQCSSKRRRFIP
jgi:hypothetical protein